MINEEKLISELKEIFNRYSVDNALNTPDFLLAEYVVNVLKAYGQAHSTTEEWHKHDDDHDDELTTSEIAEEMPDEGWEQAIPHPPAEGMKWEKSHYVCDQGHYGGWIWVQVKDEEIKLKYSMIFGSNGHYDEEWIIYETGGSYILDRLFTLPGGTLKLEIEAKNVLNAMNQSKETDT